MDKEWLYNEYVTKDRSTQDIADEYGCKRNTIQCWLSKHKIKKDVVKREYKPKFNYQKKDYLYNEHIVKHKSMTDIANENNVSVDAIRYNLNKCGINYWVLSPKTNYTESDEQEIVKLYTVDGLSANKISEMLGTDHSTIIRILKKNHIKTRTMQEAQFQLNGINVDQRFYDSDWLRNKHWTENMTCKEIGEIFGVEAGTIRRQMQKLGVPTKTNSESKIGLMSGDKHHNWQGGITELDKLLREYFHTNQVPKIAKRDNYTCQLCGKTNTVLHVHHIIHFSDIVKEICSEHKDLKASDPQDRQKLYNIIVKDERFLDEDNLITYCKDCHFYKIHNYIKRDD